MSINKIYGFCPVCGYELTLENSTFSADYQDMEANEEAIKKYLFEYHCIASPDCLARLKGDIKEWLHTKSVQD